MRNKLFTILFIFPFVINSQWTKINTNISRNLNAIAFSSPTSAVVVGDSGTILRSTNIGTSFSPINSGTNKNLKDIFFINGLNGFIVGNTGTILKTTNGGALWTTVNSPSTADLNAISFSDNNNGLIAGNNGTILKTTNGGITWNVITPVTVYYLNSIIYLSSSVIICGSNGTLLRSTNEGNSWISISTSTTAFLSDISIYGLLADSLMMVGNNGLTIVSPNSLTTLQKDTVSQEWLKSLYYQSNNNTCFAVGTGGTILYSTDGASWSTIASGVLDNLNDIEFINDTTALIVGNQGTVLKTVTGGISNDIAELFTPTFKVYPNPTHGIFFIRGITEKTEITLINFSGVRVFQQYLSADDIVSVSANLSPGIYLLSLNNNNNQWIQKIIIE